MALPDDLLDQARDLVHRDPRRPRQASLRRGVSTAYYALFHLLIDSATSFLVAGRHRLVLRESLGRAFQHRCMKNASKGLAAGHPPPWMAQAIAGQPIEPELVQVASTFTDLQHLRHEADYNRMRRFTREEAATAVDDCGQAFVAWQHVRATPQAEVYLVALLAADQMRG